MDRLHAFCISCLLCCISILAPIFNGSGITWNAEETSSRIFGNNLLGRAEYKDTSKTLSRWDLLALAIQPNSPVVLEPNKTSVIHASQPICSINASGTPPYGSQYNCSTSQTGVAGPPDNYDCSVASISGDISTPTCSIRSGTSYCSTGPLGGPQGKPTRTCSAAGGISAEPPNQSSGSVACSVGGGGQTGAAFCSTNGDYVSPAGRTLCSTFQTQHLSCSAGTVNGESPNKCSARQGGVEGAEDSCSVINGAPAAGYQNKCSAVGTDEGGSAYCSTFATAGGTSTTFCSVTNNQTNAQCTVFKFNDPNTNNLHCSAYDSSGDDQVPNTTCSIYINGVFQGPVNGVCGSGTSHE